MNLIMSASEAFFGASRVRNQYKIQIEKSDEEFFALKKLKLNLIIKTKNLIADTAIHSLSKRFNFSINFCYVTCIKKLAYMVFFSK